MYSISQEGQNLKWKSNVIFQEMKIVDVESTSLLALLSHENSDCCKGRTWMNCKGLEVSKRSDMVPLLISVTNGFHDRNPEFTFLLEPILDIAGLVSGSLCKHNSEFSGHHCWTLKKKEQRSNNKNAVKAMMMLPWMRFFKATFTTETLTLPLHWWFHAATAPPLTLKDFSVLR